MTSTGSVSRKDNTLDKVYLNIGCGNRKLPGFINIDVGAGSDFQWDVTQGLPFANNSVHGIFGEHFIEHLSQKDAVRFLRECRRVLVPGGVLRLATPDLEDVVANYHDPKWREQAWLKQFDLEWIDNSCELLNVAMREWGHQWVYNEEELARLGGYAGLGKAVRCVWGQSKHAMFQDREWREESTLILEFTKDKPAVKGDPLVSVLIAAYNSDFFPAALKSAMDQTYKNLEIVVCDDCPTDAIEKITAEFSSDSRIRYYRNSPPLGAGDNYRKLMSLAKGEYIKYLNDDDLLHPECVERMARCLDSHPDVTLVTSHRQCIDAGGNLLGDIQATTRPVAEDSILEGSSTLNALLTTQINFIGEPTTAMFRKKDLIDGKRDMFSFAGREGIWLADVMMWLNLLSKGDAIYLVDSLSSFRLHNHQQWAEDGSREKGLRAWQAIRFDGARMGLYTPNIPAVVIAAPLDSAKDTTVAASKAKKRSAETADGGTESKLASIIVVTHNSSSTLRKCLDSVFANTHCSYELIIVDNASTDETVNILKEYEGRAKIILNKENVGFSKASNQGIRASSGAYVCLLNPDTMVPEGWLEGMISHFGPYVGAVGPTSDNVMGSQKVQLYLPKSTPSQIDMGAVVDLLKQHNTGKAVETKLLVGFCVLLSRAVLDKVGLLDEDLILGNDDTELSWRLRMNGYRLLVASDVFVHHEWHVSFKASDDQKKADALVQESFDVLYKKLTAHYGEGNVPHPMELWGVGEDCFSPTCARFKPAPGKGEQQGGDLEFTGERMVPGKADAATEAQHLVRYEFVKQFAAGKRVLDAGCGSGYGSHMLSEVAESVVGIDIAADAIAHAKRNYNRPNLEYKNVDARTTGFLDASFDLVVSFEVVEHLPDPQAYLQELRRVLKPGGTLVISTPNRLLTSPGSVKPLNPYHAFEWTMQEFTQVLGKHFAIRDMWGQQSFGGWAVRPDATEYDLFFLAFCGELPAGFAEVKQECMTRAASKTVSVVIPAFNQASYTRKCLTTLLADDHPKEIIVVDNGSTDETPDLAAEFKQVKFIRNTENRGFAAACNQGIQAANGDYVMLLNNDTLMPKGTIKRLVECAETDPSIGLVSPMSNAVRGLQAVQGCNKPEDYQIFADAHAMQYKGTRWPVMFMAGLCLLIKRSCLEKVGLFDEIYGIGNYEDDDYCLRASLAGFTSIIAVDSFVFHYGSQTFKASGEDYRSLMERNFEKFFEKWKHVDIIRPRLVSDLVVYGTERGEAGDYAEGIRYFVRALELDPKCADALRGLGICLANDGRLEDALATLTELVKLYPDDEEGRTALEQCYHLLNPSDTQKVGRNQPCPCGSGRKYKKCCWGKNRNAVLAA